jgi:PAS domain S-box-containing protein
MTNASGASVSAEAPIDVQDSARTRAVQVYESDDLLRETAAWFLAEGLSGGEPAIVIATQGHWDAFQQQLCACGLDVEGMLISGRLVYLDACSTLARLMDGLVPDRRRFMKMIGDAVERLTSGALVPRFRAYGEMVDLLCGDGNREGAVLLQELWNELASKYPFSLLFGYSIRDFQMPTEPGSTDRIGMDVGAAPGEIARLRQYIRKLEAEIGYRKQLENELRRNNRELEDFFEEAAESIHRVAPDGTILSANKAELHFLGYTRDEYVGHHIAEFHVDPDVIDDILARLVRGETLQGYEARMRCKDSSVRHVLINSNVFRENGQFIHTRCFTRDITERKRAEAGLRFLVEAGAEIGNSLDYESTLTTVCRMCVPRLADWAAIDLKVGGAIKRVAVHHADPAKVELAQELWRRMPDCADAIHGVGHVIRTGEPEVLAEVDDAILDSISDAGILDSIRKLGLRSSLCVPLTAGNETIGAITFAAAESGYMFGTRDVPLAEELARRLTAGIVHARLFEDVQVATRTKDEFLATVSHELRTPLTAILGWARMLKDGQLSLGKMERAFDAIERNSLAQVQLVEDLLDVSRIISGKLRLDVQPIALSSCLDAAIESVQHAIHAKNIQFHRIVDDSAGPIAGDIHRIQQVIWNLLSNAVKFTPKGGTIRLAVERDDGSLQLTVSDTGQGIASHLLPSVFERFKQADGSTARIHGGLGLGLAIVRHIVELHGGSVRALSDGEGRGATFVLRLPLAPLPTGTVGTFRQSLHAGAGAKFERPKELQGLTVLIIDDEVDTREFLTEVLEQCGCSVLAAAGAKEGIAILETASPRVVVCDIGMPDVDGYDFIRAVRQRPAERGGRTVAVALTAYTSAEDHRRALRAGFQMHIAKPIVPAEFVANLANLAQLAMAMC